MNVCMVIATPEYNSPTLTMNLDSEKLAAKAVTEEKP